MDSSPRTFGKVVARVPVAVSPHDRSYPGSHLASDLRPGQVFVIAEPDHQIAVEYRGRTAHVFAFRTRPSLTGFDGLRFPPPPRSGDVGLGSTVTVVRHAPGTARLSDKISAITKVALVNS